MPYDRVSARNIGEGRRGEDDFGRRMRIIAGKWRSRRLEWVLASTTRPMPDRVKESIFNVLGVHYQTLGELPALHVADVFSGTGSLGLEALSRGASHCVFFERDPAALPVLRRNIASFGAAQCCEVITEDAWREAPKGRADRRFDLIFLDPPYADSLDPTAHGRVRTFLARLAEHASNGTLVILHHPAGTVYELGPDEPWRVLDERTIGSNRITMFSR